MADSIQFRRGLRSTVKPLEAGMPGFITDEQRLVIGNGDGTNAELPNKTDMDNINSQMADIVNVKSFGAKGDGTTDDTLSIQNAFNSKPNGGLITIPSGIYKISDTINFGKGHKIIGQSRNNVIINMIDDTKPALQFLSSLNGDGYDIDCGIDIESLTIVAKTALKFNQKGDYATIFHPQGHLKGIIINNLILRGTYSQTKDTNYETNILPTYDEISAFGVGISFVKVFDSVISNCQIQNFGIGVDVDGSDINLITNNRIAYNAWNIYAYGHNNYGSLLKITNNDMLANRRIPSIYLNAVGVSRILNNYFETYSDAAQHIKTINDIGTNIQGNKFDDSGKPNTPFISLTPRYGFNVSNNTYISSGVYVPVEIKSNCWNFSQKELGIYKDNTREMPVPDFPMIMYSDLDNYKFNYKNYNTLGGGEATSSFPFISDSDGWHLNNINTCLLRFSIKSIKDKKFLVTIIGKKINAGSTGGGQKIDYIENGTDYDLGWGVPLSTGLKEVVQYTIALPSGTIGNGYLKFELINSEANFYDIELKPVDYEIKTAIPKSGTYQIGDKIYNSNPTAGSYEGWLCVASGTPGTWKGFGLIQS